MQCLEIVYLYGHELYWVRCGSEWGARRLPKRIGEPLMNGTAKAFLHYDGKPRTAVKIGGRYYMRISGGPRECCTRCGSSGDVAERFSFGVYAGRLCRKCCYHYRDHCGIDQPEGRPEDYEGQYWED